MTTASVTLLFTDLANSAELLQRAGDEQAQRIFQAHHRLLKRFVAAHGGQEMKWLGDGFMTVFASPADAGRCARRDAKSSGLSIDDSCSTVSRTLSLLRARGKQPASCRS